LTHRALGSLIISKGGETYPSIAVIIAWRHHYQIRPRFDYRIQRQAKAAKTVQQSCAESTPCPRGTISSSSTPKLQSAEGQRAEE